MLKRIIFIVLLIIVACSCQKSNKDSDMIKIKEVKKGDIVEKISEVGKLEPYSLVKVKSNVTGTIKKLYVDEGDFVNAGKVLAVVQPGREVEQYLTSEITAPALGVVIEKVVEEGDMVTSGLSEYSGGTVLMSIANLSKMVIKVDINEVDIAKIKVGLPAKIKIEAFKEKEYEGKVTKISPMAKVSSDGKINVFKTEVEVISKFLELKPGMKAVVEIKIDERKGVLILPVESVYEEYGEQVVYLKEKEKVVRKKIKVGLYDDNNIEILEGLQEKDKVLVGRPEGADKIKEGSIKEDRGSRGMRGPVMRGL